MFVPHAFGTACLLGLCAVAEDAFAEEIQAAD